MSEKILNRKFPDWEPNAAQRRSGRALCRLLGVSDYAPVVTDAGPGFLLGESEGTALLFVRLGEDGIPKEWPLVAPRVWQALGKLFLRSVREGDAEEDSE